MSAPRARVKKETSLCQSAMLAAVNFPLRDCSCLHVHDCRSHSLSNMVLWQMTVMPMKAHGRVQLHSCAKNLVALLGPGRQSGNPDCTESQADVAS